ncbi:hypothetical protein BU25DRAFT_439744 [Macroventuria anomochaeta]|uniref:Uncharacterized protein n=1 Tax=Macroventuria anomochaeta TaxID=301207 RepID=A0ACB6S0T2_9PLEO|nr:uncharacterized protein BU25DRAFT_439744 [Macroventuria anomochaeta]KAF2627761.1 hypothetical protein BU25DRAFT_439744 [Macroventuria anomochaeta]
MFRIGVRTIARWRRVQSLFQFAIDNWLVLTAVSLFYTGLIVCLNVIAQGGGSNLFPPEQFSTFTQEEIQERTKGTQIVIPGWLLKACMLLLFARMTSGTTHIKWIKIVVIYVVIGWVAVQVAFFTACMPFSGYWAVPVSNPQCTTLEHFAIVQAKCNLSSDVLIIAVPVPVVMSLSLPTKQKIGVGVAVQHGHIIASILTKVYNLSDVYDNTCMLWYTRKASVAVYHIRFLRDHTNSYITGQSRMPRYGYSSNYGNLSRHQRSHICATVTNVEPDERASVRSSSEMLRTDFRSGKARLDSDERATNDLSYWKGMDVMEVQVDTKVEIQRVGWNRAPGIPNNDSYKGR